MSFLLITLMLFTGLLTALAYLAKVDGAFEALTHFRLHFFLIQLCCALLLAALKRPRWTVATCLLMLLNWVYLSPYIFSSRPNPGVLNAKISLLQLNLMVTNQAHSKVLQCIHTYNPDIITVQEVSPEWASVLGNALTAYPYRVIVAKENPFGIALFSKIPLYNTRVSDFTMPGQILNSPEAYRFPTIVTDIRMANKPVTLIVTHPMPPIVDMELRNRQLFAIAHNQTSLSPNLLVVGDLNITPWSPFFQEFLKEAKLKDSQQGFGIQASWKSIIPFVHLPIDHILVSKQFKIIKRQLGPEVGSDHYPVYAELGF